MVKVKTSELQGAALDYAAACIEGLKPENGWSSLDIFRGIHVGGGFKYSSDWSQGGPIIEREEISLTRQFDGTTTAHNMRSFGAIYGPTPLIAAMRCYVASRLGDVVDIPEELVGG